MCSRYCRCAAAQSEMRDGGVNSSFAAFPSLLTHRPEMHEGAKQQCCRCSPAARHGWRTQVRRGGAVSAPEEPRLKSQLFGRLRRGHHGDATHDSTRRAPKTVQMVGRLSDSQSFRLSVFVAVVWLCRPTELLWDCRVQKTWRGRERHSIIRCEFMLVGCRMGPAGRR